MDPNDHEDIGWLHTQLTGQVNNLSNIYERISFTIRRLQDEKVELQNRVELLEQDNPSTELRRLREENSTFRARLATAAKEKAEVTRERDTLFRKLHSIRQLIDGQAFHEREASTDAQNSQPFPRSPTSTVRSPHDPHASALAKHNTITTTAITSPTHTAVSEPKTDITTIHDTFGRVIRAASSSEPAQTSQALPSHTSTTLIDARSRAQDSAAPSRVPVPPFLDAHELASPPPPPPLPPAFRPLHIDQSGSPSRGSPGAARILSLNSSPGMSEGLSVQYDDKARPLSGTAGTATVTVQKWKIHFAKPPSSTTVVALPKPVPTATLVQNLELDEDTRRAIERLSSEPADTLRLYICDTLGLAFLYDPVLLESTEATYVVEWSEVKASQDSKAYITASKEKHTELHTFIYAPRKNGWHYLGQQRWSLVDIKSIWQALGPPAQRAIAIRAFPNSDAGEITRRLKRGQIEQLTVELQQVSLVQPNPGEAVLMTKLHD